MPGSRNTIYLVLVSCFALLLTIGIWILKFGRSLDEMYGDEGLLQRQQDFYHEVMAGDKAMKSGRYEEAQRRYEAALTIAESTTFKTIKYNWDSDMCIALLGVGDSLVAQQRFEEANDYYGKALDIRRQYFEVSHPAIIEILGRITPKGKRLP